MALQLLISIVNALYAKKLNPSMVETISFVKK